MFQSHIVGFHTHPFSKFGVVSFLFWLGCGFSAGLSTIYIYQLVGFHAFGGIITLNVLF